MNNSISGNLLIPDERIGYFIITAMYYCTTKNLPGLEDFLSLHSGDQQDKSRFTALFLRTYSSGHFVDDYLETRFSIAFYQSNIF
jgi:hypothetical protein